MKNTKKAEQKKRRAVTRRVSEGDVENFSASSVDAIHKSGKLYFLSKLIFLWTIEL